MSGMNLSSRSTEDIANGVLRIEEEITEPKDLIKIIQSVNTYNDKNSPEITVLYVNIKFKFISDAYRSKELMSQIADSKLLGICVTFMDPVEKLNPQDVVHAMRAVKARTEFQNSIIRTRMETENRTTFGLFIPRPFKEASDNVTDVSDNKFAEKFFNLYWKQYWLKRENEDPLTPSEAERILLSDSRDLQSLFNPDDYQRIMASKEEFLGVINKSFATAFAFLRAKESEDQIPVIQKVLLEALIYDKFCFDDQAPENLLVLTPQKSLKVSPGAPYSVQSEARKMQQTLAKALGILFNKYTMQVPFKMQTRHETEDRKGPTY